MEPENQTRVAEFLLLGLSEDPELQPVLFGLLLTMYLVTVLGNLLIVLAVTSDSHLHTPMYFFLSNLSIVEICCTSTVIPKMLLNIQTESKTISYAGCLTQVCFVLYFAGIEHFLLAAMAYDHYAAICHLHRYSVIMNPHLCVLLILLFLSISIVDALLHSLMVLRLSFCTDLEIPHFFCELDQVIKLSYSASLINNILFYLVSGILSSVPLLGIIYTYIKIVSSVPRISSQLTSAGVRHKAFSTCGSHLSVVSLCYGTGFGVCISSAVTDSSTNSAAASVMYTVVPPKLNPFIYSLRSRDMKEALRNLIIKPLFW
uniref:G-protein coupled receptors family 1 profile domain-containing protein n=1 Tax=Sciurus vulgaris TaxID=55149 RepID=A0A8D2DP81_SCIVU